MPGPADYNPCRLLLPLGRRGRDRGEVSIAPRPGPGQWVAVARALKLCRTQPPAFSPGPPAHPQARGWGAYSSGPQSFWHQGLLS